MKVPFGANSGIVPQAQQDRLEAAEEIEQKPQDVLIQAGDGADVVFGTRTAPTPSRAAPATTNPSAALP
jgi:hypothetical protein